MPIEKRERQLGVMLTESEMERVMQVAKDYGMTYSSAGRYLIKRGLDVEEPPFPTRTEE